MKANDNDDAQGTPSPYQDADTDVEIAEVSYMSSTNGHMVFLGKTIRKITRDGKVSYTLLDPSGRIIGPPVDDEQTSQEIWSAIAEMLERRAMELRKNRGRDDQGQSQSKDH